MGSIISGRKDLGDEGTAKGPDAPKSKNEKLLKSEDISFFLSKPFLSRFN